MKLTESCFETPIGRIVFAARERVLYALGFIEQWPALRRRIEARFGSAEFRDEPDSNDIGGRIRDYLGGSLHALDAIDVDPGGTDFQRRIWTALRAIPPGATTSYSALAASIGAPRHARAAGAANGANPISLVIPCHRVIRSDGNLCGYAGGVDRKRWLLAHESTAH